MPSVEEHVVGLPGAKLFDSARQLGAVLIVESSTCWSNVAATRVGAKGPRGAVAQVPVRGVIAAQYNHYDSRASDPQLHTHVVVANRVQAVRDGKWRTLDSRALHTAVTGLSEHYNAVLSDHLTQVLGVGWEARERGPGRSTAWEIAGVSQVLMDEFSSGPRDIEQVRDPIAVDVAGVTDGGRTRRARRAVLAPPAGRIRRFTFVAADALTTKVRESG